SFYPPWTDCLGFKESSFSIVPGPTHFWTREGFLRNMPWILRIRHLWVLLHLSSRTMHWDEILSPFGICILRAPERIREEGREALFVIFTGILGDGTAGKRTIFLWNFRI